MVIHVQDVAYNSDIVPFTDNLRVTQAVVAEKPTSTSFQIPMQKKRLATSTMFYIIIMYKNISSDET